MNVHLMYSDKDFCIEKKQQEFRTQVYDDLEITTIIKKMAEGDLQIKESCEEALYRPLQTQDEIAYRQHIFFDCLKNKDTIRRLYLILSEIMEEQKKFWLWLTPDKFLSTTYSSAKSLLQMYLKKLKEYRTVIDKKGSNFSSEGFRSVFSEIQNELTDEYINEADNLLTELKEDNGFFMSCSLGSHCQGVNYVLRKRAGIRKIKPIFKHAYTIEEESTRESEDLTHRKELAINACTNALGQAADNIGNFVLQLYKETAFYIGALNLYEYLTASDMPVCIPEITTYREWNNLYDVSLAVIKGEKIKGNSLNKKNCKLYIITGANQGGKTTFLRSFGQAQLMMQSGLFVGAEKFNGPVRQNIFTHFTREEDRAMDSGKLDEELSRMGAITDFLKDNALVLFNESFASTNEREGSEILRQITLALIENNIEVFSVTHLYTFTKAFEGRSDTLFLRAERLQTGERTFKIMEGKPLRTAYGEDLYRKIFSSPQ